MTSQIYLSNFLDKRAERKSVVSYRVNIYRHKVTNRKIYWKCFNANCNARATTSNGELIKSSDGHMYKTDLKSQMKNIMIARLANSSFGSVNQLCDTYAFGSDTVSRIVSFDGIKASIYR
jgi:spore coat protein CotF